jgi:hypothetical protein
MNLKWEYFVSHYDSSRFLPSPDTKDNRHTQFVKEFASVVSVFQVRLTPFFCKSLQLTTIQDKINNLIDLHDDIQRYVEELSSCPYTSDAISDLLTKIQAVVGLHKCSSL